MRGEEEERTMLAELRVTPVGPKTSFARLIADLVPVLAESPLQYQVHAMGTTLEGDLEPILELVRRSHEEARKHADRVLIELSLDDRTSAEGEIVRGLQHVRDLRVEAPLERLGPPATSRGAAPSLEHEKDLPDPQRRSGALFTPAPVDERGSGATEAICLIAASGRGSGPRNGFADWHA
jgi:uncharacterized protein (TIGR00106 family)